MRRERGSLARFPCGPNAHSPSLLIRFPPLVSFSRSPLLSPHLPPRSTNRHSRTIPSRSLPLLTLLLPFARTPSLLLPPLPLSKPYPQNPRTMLSSASSLFALVLLSSSTLVSAAGGHALSPNHHGLAARRAVLAGVEAQKARDLTITPPSGLAPRKRSNDEKRCKIRQVVVGANVVVSSSAPATSATPSTTSTSSPVDTKTTTTEAIWVAPTTTTEAAWVAPTTTTKEAWVA